MTAVTAEGITANYAYNVQHQRVSKSVGGTTTRFFYGQGGELLSERAAEYVWLDGKPLAYITNGQVYQVHNDHLGTPQVLTDASGTAAWEAEFRPFGEAVTTGNLSFPLRFPGQYHDAETGLHYNWHRYYDPATGRYLTSDPIGLEGGLNPYLYAEGNPLYFTDPEGLMAAQLIGGVVGFIVGYATTSGDTYDAIVNGIQAGAAGFISGGGSLTLGFTASAGASLIRSHLECGEVGLSQVIDASAMGGAAIIGGYAGKAVASLAVRPRWQYVERHGIARAVAKILRIPQRKVDTNQGIRQKVATFFGAGTENILASKYSACGCGVEE